MKKFAIYSIVILIGGWVGLSWLIDEAFNEYVDRNIAGDYYEQATSDDYRIIYSKKTDFSIPLRVVSIHSDKKFIVAISKQEENLEPYVGPCEYFVIDHVNGAEHIQLDEQSVENLLGADSETYRSFLKDKRYRCEGSPVFDQDKRNSDDEL